MRREFLGFAVALALVLVVAFLMTISVAPSEAAPMPAPTPVAVDRTGAEPSIVDLIDARSTVDDITGPCVAVSSYERADIYYSVTIDGDNVNTTTLTLQHGNSPAVLVDGVAVASTVATTTEAMQQVQLFGAYLCLKVDATDASTGTVVVTANALLK